MTDAIVKTIDVPCSASEAFDVFVTRIASWWPLDEHASSAADGKAAKDVTIEPRVGGAFYETRHDGTRNDWGEVLEFVEGARFATTWHPGNNRDCPTRVDVSFEDLPDGRACVTLTHSGWEIWGEKADDMRGGYNSGWDSVLGCFVQVL